MVIQLSNQPSMLARTAPARRLFPRPQFQGNCNSTANALISDVKHINFAKRLFNFFGSLVKNPNVFGLSINDIASRINVFVAVYLPALFFSLHPHKKHFWETNGRNVLIWLTTIAVTLLGKHPKYGVNALLNKLMVHQQKDFPQTDTWKQKASNAWHHTLNTLKPDYDYYELLKIAGIDISDEASKKRENKWSGLDNNQIEQLKIFKAKLEKGQIPKHLTPEEVKLFTENATKLMNRLSTMKLVSFGLITAATVYVVGILAMEIVFRYIAPLDPDFDASKLNKHKKKGDNPLGNRSHPSSSIPTPTGTLNGIYQQGPVSFYPPFPPVQPFMVRPIPPNVFNPRSQGGQY